MIIHECSNPNCRALYTTERQPCPECKSKGQHWTTYVRNKMDIEDSNGRVVEIDRRWADYLRDALNAYAADALPAQPAAGGGDACGVVDCDKRAVCVDSEGFLCCDDHCSHDGEGSEACKWIQRAYTQPAAGGEGPGLERLIHAGEALKLRVARVRTHVKEQLHALRVAAEAEFGTPDEITAAIKEWNDALQSIPSPPSRATTEALALVAKMAETPNHVLRDDETMDHASAWLIQARRIQALRQAELAAGDER